MFKSVYTCRYIHDCVCMVPQCRVYAQLFVPQVFAVLELSHLPIVWDVTIEPHAWCPGR